MVVLFGLFRIGEAFTPDAEATVVLDNYSTRASG
jgi:hypothetical protein